MAQSVEHLTLGFGSGHDLRVLGSSSTSGSRLSTVSVPLPLLLPTLLLSPFASSYLSISVSLSLSQIKKQKKRGVYEVNKPNVKSVCGCTVEIRPQCGVGQLLALHAAYIQAVKDLGFAWRSIRQILQCSCLF